jgi:rubrerythrin
MEKLITSYKEIIEFAIGHELKACELYEDLAEKMVHSETRQLCKKLAEEERRHIAMLEKEGLTRCQLTAPVNTGRYVMAEAKVNVLVNQLSMLSFAMKKEKISAKLYRDLANLTRNESARQLFVHLAEEELKHEKQIGLEYNNCLK